MVGPTEDWIRRTTPLQGSGVSDDDRTAEPRRTGVTDHLTQALYVKNLVELDGLGVEQAVRRAATRYGVPEAMVHRHYGEHGHAVGEGCNASNRVPERGRTSLAGAPGRRAIWVREPTGTRPT